MGFGEGENEAIILAKDMNAALAIDDDQPRKVAKAIGIQTIGSVGLVRFAFEACMIDQVEYFGLLQRFEREDRAYPEVVARARLAPKHPPSTV